MNFANNLERKRAIIKAKIPERIIEMRIIVKSLEEIVFSNSLTPAAVPVLALFIE